MEGKILIALQEKRACEIKLEEMAEKKWLLNMMWRVKEVWRG